MRRDFFPQHSEFVVLLGKLFAKFEYHRRQRIARSGIEKEDCALSPFCLFYFHAYSWIELFIDATNLHLLFIYHSQHEIKKMYNSKILI